MSGFKTSEGGSITTLGSSGGSFDLTAGLTEIVTDGTNVRGVVVRTAMLRCRAVADELMFLVGGVSVFGHKKATADGEEHKEWPREIFVPAGNAISFFVSAGTPTAFLSYDIL